MRRLHIHYVEFTSRDLPATQDFMARALGWGFTDYGPAYQELRDAGLAGGIAAGTEAAAPLVILKADDLEAAQAQIEAAGGTIIQPIFPFPGGRRFHFREPGGTEMAVWAEA